MENRNLSLLPGLHESYLNSAVHSHMKGFVADWIEHFRQEWATFLFQDRFPLLVQALRKNLSSDKGMIMMLSRVFERAESCVDDQEVSDMRREVVGAHGELAPELTIRTVETEAIEFIKNNRTLLPKYYIPGK